MSKTREVRPFGARDKFGYLFGDLANDFSFIFASTYVMVFYTKVMGIRSWCIRSYAWYVLLPDTVLGSCDRRYR